jgi:O-antigen/teichoic acid export membrane protein
VTSSVSPVAVRTAATWVTLIASVVFLFAARALIARVLGPTGIGTYALMLTAAWLAGTILSLGLPAYNASFAGKHEAGVLLSNSIAWNVVALGALTLACAPAMASTAASTTQKAMILGVWMAPLMAVLECTRGVFQGTSAIAAYNWLGLTGGALNLAGVALLAASSRLTLGSAVACWIGSTIVSAAVAVSLAARQGDGLSRVDARVLRAGLKFGGQAWLSQLTGILNFRIALLLTQSLLGLAAVGLYSIAIMIAEVLFYFPNALAVVTVSRYASATPPAARRLLLRSAAWVVAVNVACALGLAILAGPVIERMFGPSYAASSHVLRILLPGVVAYTPVAVTTWYVNAHLQKPMLNLLIAGFSAAVNAALTLVWAPRYGTSGVAWATSVAYISASLLNVVVIHRQSSSGPGSLARLAWRALGLLDVAVAVPVYLLFPRHVRERWAQPGTVQRNRRVYDEILALLETAPRARGLVVGGGAAAVKATLGSGAGIQVVTLDLDLGMLRRGAARMVDPMLVCADGTRLPFADDTFDAVVMVHALEHIPAQVRVDLAAELKRVSRGGVVIHGPAGPDAIRLSEMFIAALRARGADIPRYAREHLEFSMPMPEWFTQTFPGCELRPRRNLNVELATILTEFTPVARWLAGYRNRRLAAHDDRPPFVEYTMTWRKRA